MNIIEKLQQKIAQTEKFEDFQIISDVTHSKNIFSQFKGF